MTTVLRRFLKAALIIGVATFMMAAGANAAGITYTTNALGTEFVAGINSLTLNSISGLPATLVFTPNPSGNSGVPSNVDLGHFILACPSCTTNQGTTFGSFTFDLVVTDLTDGGAQGMFVGTSTGGTVSINSSTVQITWQSPLIFGPGTTNALGGNFGNTFFDMVSPTSLIVAPNSGSTPGDTTIQGQVDSVPEPATSGLIGGALMGLGLLRRRKSLRP